MTSTIIRSIQLLLSISTLIIVHELGHFILAKIFKVRVEKFFLFFNPWFSIFSKKIGDTIYGLGWLPLGGYVKISGIITTEDVNHHNNTKKNDWEFRSKSSIKKLLIISGGIISNILLSIIIFTCLLFQYGEIYLPTKNIPYGIEVDDLGKNIGLKNGDKILFVNGQYIQYFNEIPKAIILGDSITIDRMGKIVHLSLDNNKKRYLFDRKKFSFFIRPRIPIIIDDYNSSSTGVDGLKKNDEILAINSKFVLFSDQLKNFVSKYKNENILITINREGTIIHKNVYVDNKGLLGSINLKSFMDMDNIFLFEKKKYSLIESFFHGTKKSWNVLKNQIFFFKNVFHIQTKAYKQIGSLFSMAKEFPSTWNWNIFWTFTATLSIWLAFLNLFPIPSLDGGYILFIIIEMITKKRINESITEKCTVLGFLIISVIMIFIIIWDIFKVLLY
ncbi:RIP metalloprotease RseP [Blattabacterium cuenoti]|uniref:RIP metalloprotease RseP n=1 Tax=Blattabacterium cuenoti TaxID=1653831 RepID=UPI00163BAECE|nr:RIP metalloprotease RseP [Blattabacterium cuenoti]